MDRLKEAFHQKAQELKATLRVTGKEYGARIVDEVSLEQMLGGMRDVKSMLWETSELDSEEGIRFRGFSIPELRDKLPKRPGDSEPLPEGLFWLMLIGEIPSQEDVNWLSDEWERRCKIPDHTWKVLDGLSKDTHPMTQFSIGVMSLQTGSLFAKRYAEGMSKDDYWSVMYEDSMNLIACLPRIAAYIYRSTYFDGKHIAPDQSLDWAGNFAHMLGVTNDEDFKSLMRLYLTIHADHEGGNASAHTVHLVGSTLSDAYLSFAAGLNALAGPLHGLANQEVIKWIFEMIDKMGTDHPSDDQIRQYVHDTINAGQVIPGYGHAVLRKPDPRFLAQKSFAEVHLPNNPIVQIVWKLYELIPPILQSLGKVKNPWPNVDAHSGSILVHYGLKQYQYYTVLFGVSRALGVLASLCWSRALGLSLERPKSVSSVWLKGFLEKKL
ncbi:MAG TPA: citrate (Si)-synthase [Saprospiraceae bacterium]|nr:citrate (Si)-synthase [Saprospiraceae bacterium]